MQACMLECEQVMASGDARTAVGHYAVGTNSPHCLNELLAKNFRRQESAGLVEVPLEKVIRGSGNVAWNTVDGFGLAAISLRSSRVHQPPFGVVNQFSHLVDVDGGTGLHFPTELARRSSGSRRSRLGWPRLGDPFRKTSIQYRHRVVIHPAKEPPQPAGPRSGVLVVGDHLHAITYAESFERPGEHRRVRKRMPAIRPGLSTGQIPVEVGIHGARHMRFGIRPFAPGGVIQLEPTIDDNEPGFSEMS